MTRTFSFHGSLNLYWKTLYAEYRKFATLSGKSPFEFELPNPKVVNIDEYIPVNGDEIMITFRDGENTRELLVIEAELLSDEDKTEVHIFIHPQGNPFEEPVKSAMLVWMEIKKALKNAEKRRVIGAPKRRKVRKAHPATEFALEKLRGMYFESLQNKSVLPKRRMAADKVGIAVNTWRIHDRQLWVHWEDDGYRNQKMQ